MDTSMPPTHERKITMGILFGRKPGDPSLGYGTAKRLGRKLPASSTGAAVLKRVMSDGQDPRDLCPEEAEQAAKSLRDAAPKLRGDDRAAVQLIADSAQRAADAGETWRVG